MPHTPRSGLVALLALGLLIPFFATPTIADDDVWYEVRQGDYLSRIADRFGTTIADLKRDNKLTTDLIHPEQRLLVARPFNRSSPNDIFWRHPYADDTGETLHSFGDQRNGNVTTRHSSVNMAYPRGARVVAPAHGIVRYLGEQDGYGHLMILDHGSGYATVLGPFDDHNVYVQSGQLVSRGDGLGLTGAPVETGRPYLHIELRRDNKAVDPARLMR